jgi:hypothetical protein
VKKYEKQRLKEAAEKVSSGKTEVEDLSPQISPIAKLCGERQFWTPTTTLFTHHCQSMNRRISGALFYLQNTVGAINW